MGMLQLKLLGAPEVRHDEQVVQFPTRKALALLIYLAVEGGKQPREKLTALFWPESDGERGRAALRITLAYLRTALREESDAQHDQHLLVERNALSFRADAAYECDVHPLQMAAQLLNRPETPHALLMRHLEPFVDQYRGGFLEGFSLTDAPEFDGWVGLQRAVWHRRMSLIFERLSQVQADDGALPSAVETATRWIAHDPLDEAAHRRLMLLHLLTGNRTAGLRAYEACRAILAREVGTEPAPETEALAERLRARTPRPRPSVQPSPPLKTPASGLSLPFVGRATEFDALIAGYRAACRGQIQVMTLQGEAGIGKTRLATEFLGRVAAEGATILRGRAFQSGGRLPYQPVIDALRGRLLHEERLEQLLSPVWLSELSRLFPELRERFPQLEPPLADKAGARARLFEAIARLGAALAGQTPVVVFVDDLQWADAASLDVFHYAAARWAESGAPIFLLFSLRNDALITRPALAEWCASLARELPVEHLTLGLLDVEDTLHLIQPLVAGMPGWPTTQTAQARHDTTVPDLTPFAQWLFHETKGQPFYLVETLKMLSERGFPSSPVDHLGSKTLDVMAALSSEQARSGLLPPGVREVIRTRLASLSSAASALLAAGAVLGQHFSFERVCRVAHLSEGVGLAALDELLALHVLEHAETPVSIGEESGQMGAGSYSFTHDKIREVVYSEAGEARRRLLHRRALEMLEAAGAPAAELAHHALAAGIMVPAFRHSLAAGDEALHLFAVRDAIASYEQAHRLLADHIKRWGLTEVSRTEGQHLWLQLGRAYELENAWASARAIYQEMLVFAQGQHEPEMECAALNHLATVTAHESYDLKTARNLIEEALHVAQQRGDKRGLAETEWNLAQMCLYAVDMSTMLLHGERALALARELEATELIARCLNLLIYAKSGLRQWQEAAMIAEEARALYRALGNRAMEVDCLGILVCIQIHLGQPEEAIRLGRAARAISLEIKNPWGQVSTAIHLAPALLERGHDREALTIAQEAEMLARTLRLPQMLVFVLPRLGGVYRAHLSLEKALAAHQEAAFIAETLGSAGLRAMAAAELCTDYVLMGEWEKAHAAALQVVASGESNLPYVKFTHWSLTEALLRAGDEVLAAEELERFAGEVGTNRRLRIPYLRSLATLAAWRQEPKQAACYLEEAMILAEEIDLPGEIGQMQAQLTANVS
jgi:predicted ATPase/DNA-binding SARP family transcriptional activator